LWAITCIAQEFGVLPSVAERALARDAENTDTLCLYLARYAEAKAVYDRANKEELKAWDKSKLMQRVEQYEFEAAAASMRQQT
jgi:hypothetical protein